MTDSIGKAEIRKTLTYKKELDRNLQIEVISMKGEIPGDADTVTEITEMTIQ